MGWRNEAVFLAGLHFLYILLEPAAGSAEPAPGFGNSFSAPPQDFFDGIVEEPTSAEKEW